MKITEKDGYKVMEKENGTVIRQAIPDVVEKKEDVKEESQLDRIEKKLDKLLKDIAKG